MNKWPVARRNMDKEINKSVDKCVLFFTELSKSFILVEKAYYIVLTVFSHAFGDPTEKEMSPPVFSL